MNNSNAHKSHNRPTPVLTPALNVFCLIVGALLAFLIVCAVAHVWRNASPLSFEAFVSLCRIGLHSLAQGIADATAQ